MAKVKWSNRKVVKSPNDLMIIYGRKNGKRTFELMAMDPNEDKTTTITISEKAADLLTEYGVNSGS